MIRTPDIWFWPPDTVDMCVDQYLHSTPVHSHPPFTLVLFLMYFIEESIFNTDIISFYKEIRTLLCKIQQINAHIILCVIVGLYDKDEMEIF